MIYFITTCEKHHKAYADKFYDNITLLNPLEDYDFINVDVADFILNDLHHAENKEVGFDKETNGLDAWTNTTLLDIVGTTENQYVFHKGKDGGVFDIVLDYLQSFDYTLIGHNIKFDLKFLISELGVIWRQKVYDTMIAEQRLYMGGTFSNSLDNVAYRYLNHYPNAMDKSIREDFIGANPETFFYEPKHLRYAGGDVEHLFPIKKKQMETISLYQMDFLIYDIEFPLIHIIAKAEVTGFEFDIDKWLDIYNENKTKQFELECQLDVELRRLRDTFQPTNIMLKGGKWEHVRQKTDAHALFNDDGTTNVLDLFGEPMSFRTYKGNKTKVNMTPNNFNYTSDTQIIEIFAAFDEPLPTKQGQFVTPTFNRKGKIDKSHFNFQTGESALQEYLIEYPNSIMKDFIYLLLEHRTLSTACNNFGINFKNKINTITGKLHTTFRQAAAKTGRFQCGGGRKEPDKPNFQNIPSKAIYAKPMRNCFKARDGYSIGTHDLSGAELIIMCSLSQDMKLLEASKNDMHSFVATGSWREIYTHRYRNKLLLYNQYSTVGFQDFNQEAFKEELIRLRDLAVNFTVSKKTPKLRTAFKPMTFGVIYGMFAAKAGRTLTSELFKAGVGQVITKEEGQIVIDFIKREFPDVIRMVEQASEFAKNNGYLILNDRTKSRAWFPSIIEVLKGEVPQEDAFWHMNKELSEARNKKIQGTQADMIKEMSVDLQNWIYDNNLEDEITILSWVHDEIVDEHPKYLDGKSPEWEAWQESSSNSFLIYNGKPYKSFPEIKAQIMRDCANKYLVNVEMDADYEVEPYWTK